MNIPLNNIVSASDIQKNYRKIFDRAKRTHSPVLVLRNNKPEVAIIGFKDFVEMCKKLGEEVNIPIKK